MSNYLITGFHGEPHVTAENDRGLYAALFGKGRFVLPVGEEFRAEYIGNNTIRLYDGKLVDGGAAAGIPAGEYLDLYVPETAQGMHRNDLIVFQYSQDANTLIETGSFVVVLGTEAATAEEAIDPELQQQDLLSGTATYDQMPLWRVSVASTVISEPVQLFEALGEHKNTVQQIGGVLSTIGGEPVHAGGNTLIEYGSYVGAEHHGSSNPNVLTFDFKPYFVWIGATETISNNSMVGITASFLRPGRGMYITSDGRYTLTTTWEDNSVSWYRAKGTNEDAATACANQLNDSAKRYYYMAIGIAGEG